MGEIADMMLDGTLCAGCGEFLNEEPTGYPVYCAGCEKANRDAERPHKLSVCSCGKRFKNEAALNDHRKATKHEAKP